MPSTDSHWLPVLLFSLFFMIELQTKSSFRKKGFLLYPYPSVALPITEGRQGRKYCRDHEGMVLTDFLSLAYSTTFLVQPGPTAQKWHCPWWTGSSYISIKQENPPQICVRPVWWRQFLYVPSSQMTLKLYHSWLKNKQHKSSEQICYPWNTVHLWGGIKGLR